MKKLIKIILIIAVIFGIYALYTVSNAADETWTDFSNAKYEVEYGNGGSANINITGTEGAANSIFYGFITDNSSTKPEFNIANATNYGIVSYNTSTKKMTFNASEYIELNQDLYLWIVERKSSNSYNFVVEGEKIERKGYPNDYSLFDDSSYISSTGTILNFNEIAWGKHTRNIKLKIGKISDISILNTIKNNAKEGFTKLLAYSKTAPTVYENQLVSGKSSYGTYYNGYSTASLYGGENLQISASNLENGAYYFVYATLDDENGKYYPVEGVTITQASIPNTDKWFFFLYGSNDFKWSEFGNGSTSTSTPKADPDETVATTILPKTGISLTVILAILGMSLIAIVSYKKYKTWKDIK